MVNRLRFLAILFLLTTLRLGVSAAPVAFDPTHGPSTLVLFEGPNVDSNPARIDALYLANLLGHFTIKRTLKTLEQYREGDWKRYDAIFSIVYRKHYRVPEAFLRDAPHIDRPFCWLGNQIGQLGPAGTLREHGLAFERFFQDAPLNRVFYKGRELDKGDPDTNILKITDPARAEVVAWATGPTHLRVPYMVRSGKFWMVADSPFSYSSEGDRYLAFADALHDILGIQHAENHSAIVRIEDINALSRPEDLRMTLDVIRKYDIPFAFGFVPTYVNPNDRIYLHLSDRPAVVAELQSYLQHGGTPVLHGYTHQHRGVTTDDYEFWDDFGDRPVRDDSEAFISHRLEHALRESANAGLFPVTWETPHYAASKLDYRVMRRYFNTVFERRLVASALGTDQLFPYPVIDLYGQYVIPENLSYVPKEDQRIEPILKAAEAAWVVRDGYASFFYHPFLKPALLDGLLDGIQKLGFHFVDLKTFPNLVHGEGEAIATQNASAPIAGHGRYLIEEIRNANGKIGSSKISEIPADAPLRREVRVQEGQTYVALRQETSPPGLLKRLLRVAKGDFSVFQHKWEAALPGRSFQEPVQTVILWNSKARGEEALDQESFRSTLSGLGFPVVPIDVKHLEEAAFGPFTLLTVPYATAKSLSPENVGRILGTLKGGITLITDGESPLSKALGIRLGEAAPVESVASRIFATQEYHWPDHPSVPWIAEPAFDEDKIYYADRDLQHPLVVGGEFGEGKYLYFAPLYDPITGQGYGRFDGLPYLLVSEFHLSPGLKRHGADAYFDPGYRNNISIERLIPIWRRSGIRTIHAAAWHFYDKYSYDYARLIRVAHENGILVDAWFELPHVSEFFWNRHPEWREKTALLTDAHVDWRFLMNLQNPQCLKAVLDNMRQFLKANDWDGVDLAELTFESQGPERPQSFTPFNAQVREKFKKQQGFDPLELFDKNSPNYWEKNQQSLQKFYSYRRGENLNLLNIFLNTIANINHSQGRQMETIVTILDTLEHPELADRLAIDLPGAIKAINHHHAILQVEDPAVDWSKSPDRYAELGKLYQNFKLNEPFMIDINVLPIHRADQRGFATAEQTGPELLRLWQVASAQAPRVSLYSESSIAEQDWDILPYAMAEKANVVKDGANWTITSPYSVIVETGRDTPKYNLDGRPWPCANKGDVLIPPGEHSLGFGGGKHSWLDTSELETHLLSISGELLGAQTHGRGLEIEYASRARCALMFNNLPSKTFIDDKPAVLTAVKGDDGFVILAPPGQHRLLVITDSTLPYLIKFMGLILASLIVLFGIASSGLLAAVFILVTIKRRAQAVRRYFGSRKKT